MNIRRKNNNSDYYKGKKFEFLSMVDKWTHGTDNSSRKTGKTEFESSDIMEDAPIDYNRALFEFEGDRDFLKKVIEGFTTDVRKQIETIHQAIAEGNAEIVEKEAHAIKGGAANLAADGLSELALAIEVTGKQKDLDQSAQALARFEKEFHRFEDYAGNIENMR
jgi:HPt (histidine-containing phosphotransfer) domain-containing protein